MYALLLALTLAFAGSAQIRTPTPTPISVTATPNASQQAPSAGITATPNASQQPNRPITAIPTTGPATLTPTVAPGPILCQRQDLINGVLVNRVLNSTQCLQ